MENKLLELIKTRRSCRCYRPVQIEDRELAAVLEAGTFAPTSMGRQDPWIVAVQRPDLLDRLARMNAEIMGSKGNPYYDRLPSCSFLLRPTAGMRFRMPRACWKT